MTGLLATALWAALACSAGAAFPGRRSPGEALGLGAAALALVAFWSSLAGIPLGAPLLAVLGTLALALGATSLAGSLRRAWQRPSWTEVACLAWLAATLAVVFGQALHEPLLSWDARTHWTYLARLLFEEGTVRAPLLYQPTSTLAHRDYPLLLPLSEWAVFVLQGNADDHGARLVTSTFHLGFLGSLWALLARVAPRPLPAVGTALVGSTPFLLLLRDGGASSGYADGLVALQVAVYLGLVLDWSEQKGPGPLLLASLAACGVMFTKREGLPLAILCLLVPLALRPRRWREVLAHAALLALLALPWLVHWQGLPASFGLKAAADPVAAWKGLDRLPWLLVHYTQDLLWSPALWGLLWWVVAGLALSGPRHRRPEAVLLALVLAYLALHVTIYLVFQAPPWNANPTTRVRTLFHVVPALTLYAGLRAARWSEEP
ncbi:MAG: hypothetical protein ACOX9B_00105 [Candidatus Xenobium sp.]